MGEKIKHIIGHARTIQTAVLVVAYLRARYPVEHGGVHPDMFHYRFTDPTPENGFWSADIYVESYSLSVPDLQFSGELVDVCQAFVAGRGEIWT